MGIKRRFGLVGLAVLVLLGGCVSGETAGSPTPTAAVTPASDTPTAEVTPTPTPSPTPTPTPAPAPTPTRSPDPTPPPSPEEIVRVTDHIQTMYVHLPYATADNFVGQAIYSFTDGWLRYGTVMKLKQAADILAQQGYALLLWDGFRPTAAQFKLWEILPDGNYVANPNRGFSAHSRGNTVDVTLVKLDGSPVEMPTGYDDFTAAADRDYADVSPAAADHARLLEQTMEGCGFRPYFKEWWHFTDTDTYPVEEHFYPES